MNKKILSGLIVCLLFVPLAKSSAQENVAATRVAILENINQLLMQLVNSLQENLQKELTARRQTVTVAEIKPAAVTFSLASYQEVLRERDTYNQKYQEELKLRQEAEAYNTEIHKLRMDNPDLKQLTALCIDKSVKRTKAAAQICEEENL